MCLVYQAPRRKTERFPPRRFLRYNVEMNTWKVEAETELPPVVAAVKDGVTAAAPEGAAAVLGLSGDLGAGKTTFVQHLARALGVTESVTSPTFVIMKSYATTDPQWQQLVHIDAYRIESVDELAVLGFATLLQQNNTIICIEWAERVASLLPPHTKTLTITTDHDCRNLSLT